MSAAGSARTGSGAAPIPYARPLALAIAVERGHSEQWASLAQLLEIDPAQIQSATVAALAWAEEAISAPRAQG